MVKNDAEEKIDIDVERFREFYAIFDDGRTSHAGEKHDRIDKPLIERLGRPLNRTRWLAGKSQLEGWKNGTSKPTQRERKVLQAIYDQWCHDISANQEFSDRVVVERHVAELLEVEGVTLEAAGPDKFILKLARLELFRRTRQVKDAAGKPMGASAELGFSEVKLVVEFPQMSNLEADRTIASKIILDWLVSGEPPKQSGTAVGVNVRFESGRTAWRLYASPRIDGVLKQAQLIDLFDRTIEEVKVRVEVEKADFNPAVYLDKESGVRTTDTDEKERAIEQLQAQILLQRLKAEDDRFTLASGRIARR